MLKALRAAVAEADAEALRQVVVRFVEGGADLMARTEKGRRPGA